MSSEKHKGNEHGGPPERPGGPPPLDVSHIKKKQLDITYAKVSSAQMMDLYFPDEGSKSYPVVVHIHGGAFRIGDKRDIQLAPWLKVLEHGYALASINYRMSGEEIFPAAVIDCKTAIRFLRANAAKYGLDKTRIAVVGGSAGGNLGAMVAVTENRPEFLDESLGYGKESCGVQACISWFGPTDFLKMDEQFAATGLGPCDHNDADSPESEYMGGKITEIETEWVQKANPMTYIHEDIPPMYLQHGDRDHLVPTMQSLIFARAIEEKIGKGRVHFEVLEGADHADPMFETKENMRNMLAFLDEHLK